MRYPQVLVYEKDGRLARLLQGATEPRTAAHPAAEEQESRLRDLIGTPAGKPFWLLEPRRPEECLAALRRGGPSVLVLRLGRNLLDELSLLEQVSWQLPDA